MRAPARWAAPIFVGAGMVAASSPARSQTEGGEAPLPNASAYATSTVPRLGATGAPPSTSAAPAPVTAEPAPPAPPPGPPPEPAPVVAPEAPDTPAHRYYQYPDRLGWYAPDYVKIQTGGFLGAFQAVIGYAVWKDRFNLGVQYGFTPKYEDAPPVHTFAAILTVRPLRVDVGPSLFAVPLYGGMGLMASRGKNLFISQPEVYPPGYYAPTALHYLAVIGTEIGARSREGSVLTRQSLFYEIVTIDQYIDALIDNKQSRLLGALSSMVGYRASF